MIVEVSRTAIEVQIHSIAIPLGNDVVPAIRGTYTFLENRLLST